MPRSAVARRAIGTTRSVAGSGTNPREDHADEPQRCRLWDFEVDSLGSSNPSQPRRMRTADGGRMSGNVMSDNRYYVNLRSGAFPQVDAGFGQ